MSNTFWGIGNTEKLLFVMTFDKEASECKNYLDLFEGKLFISLNSYAVWGECKYDPVKELVSMIGIKWNFDTLFEWLSDNLYHILQGDPYPCHLKSQYPWELDSELKKIYSNLSIHEYYKQDELLYNWKQNNNMSCSLHGIYVPDFYIVKQGNRMLFGNEKNHIVLPFDYSRGLLIRLGEKFNQRAKELVSDNRCKYLSECWEKTLKEIL